MRLKVEEREKNSILSCWKKRLKIYIIEYRDTDSEDKKSDNDVKGCDTEDSDMFDDDIDIQIGYKIY